jgi:hypothetical protein
MERPPPPLCPRLTLPSHHITLIPGRLGADGAYHGNRSSAWLSPRYQDSGRAIHRAWRPCWRKCAQRSLIRKLIPAYLYGAAGLLIASDYPGERTLGLLSLSLEGNQGLLCFIWVYERSPISSGLAFQILLKHYVALSVDWTLQNEGQPGTEEDLRESSQAAFLNINYILGGRLARLVRSPRSNIRKAPVLFADPTS